jgi:hypothetical protein
MLCNLDQKWQRHGNKDRCNVAKVWLPLGYNGQELTTMHVALGTFFLLGL